MRTSVIVIVVAAWASAATALEPARIVVLVNSKVDTSVALGNYYCEKRGVPTKNLVALPLPVGDSISESDYDALLADPLRKAIVDRGLSDSVICILTMRGVPFRMLAKPPTPERERVMAMIQQFIDKAQQRLAVDVELMKTIGVAFPAKARGVESLESLESLFDALPAPPAELEDMIELKDRYRSVSTTRPIRIKRLLSAEDRVVAERQYLAVVQDAQGLVGLAQRLAVFSPPGAPSVETIRQRLELLERRRVGLFRIDPTAEVIEKMATLFQVTRGAIGLYAGMTDRLKMLKTVTSQSAVDSELSLLWWKDYQREGGYNNPLYYKNAAQLEQVLREKGNVVMVSRIDGPRASDALRLIKDSIAVEAEGLKGRFYIDAKGKPKRGSPADAGDPKKRLRKTQEDIFDEYLTVLAEAFARQTDVPVTLDQYESVFRVGKCPNAALYVGWGSPQNYVPAFTWKRGAVGYHATSLEAQHLRDETSGEWVPRMISAGVAATLGATDEPFLGAFPRPEDFFPRLVSGRYTVCETYWLTVSNCSWRMMLIADPLYNPFKANPHYGRDRSVPKTPPDAKTPPSRP